MLGIQSPHHPTPSSSFLHVLSQRHLYKVADGGFRHHHGGLKFTQTINNEKRRNKPFFIKFTWVKNKFHPNKIVSKETGIANIGKIFSFLQLSKENFSKGKILNYHKLSVIEHLR